MIEYGRKHTDGSRSGGQPVVDNAMLEALQKDTGIPHLPTQETYEFRLAVGGEGPLASQWSDKPHRLIYAACRIIEREAALRQPTQSDIFGVGDVQKHTLIVDPSYTIHTVKVKSLKDSQPTHSDALAALEHPTEELAEAVATALAEEAGERWDADDFTETLSGNTPADMRFAFRDSARAALTAAAAYLKAQSK